MKRHLIAALLIACFALSEAPVFAADMLAPFEKSDGKWGFVNSDHCWVIEPKFQRTQGFSDGLAAVKLGGKDFQINRAGQVLLDPTCTAKP